MAKFAPECLGEMGVAGKPKLKRKHGQIRFAIREMLQRNAQAQAVLLLMQA
jgi:hypothetical protein